MNDHKDNLTYFPLKCLNILGHNIHGSKKYATFFMVLITLVVFLLTILELILHNEGPSTWAGTIETGSVAFLILAKLFTYKFYNKALKKLLLDMNKFWPINEFGIEMEKKIRTINRFVILGIIFFLIIDIVVVVGASVSSIITKKPPVLIYNIVDFTRPHYYVLQFIWYEIFGLQVTFFLIGFDGLFVSMLMSAASQLMMLKKAITDLASGIENIKFIKKYVDHHIFLIEFVNRIENIFSYIFIIQFSISCMAFCMGIYLISSSGKAEDFVPALIYLGASLTELFLYCITGTYITAQMEKVERAVYNSNWWQTGGSEFRHAALMIMLRSQNTKTLQAIGIVNLDVTTFVAIVRFSFSVYVLMNSVGVQN